jgi:hypothetical protein
MVRKARQGRRVPRARPATVEQVEDGMEWRRANGCFITVAEGFTGEGRKKVPSFRVGLSLIDGQYPVARLAMNEDQALSLAKSLIAYSASVDHLAKYHPDGDRERCTFEPPRPSEEEVERLVDESLGPLERGLAKARGMVGEVMSVLATMQTVALEEGLLIPDGTHAEMDAVKEGTIVRRLDRVMQLVGPEAKRLLLMALYLTGDKTLAEFFDVEQHKPSNETAH